MLRVARNPNCLNYSITQDLGKINMVSWKVVLVVIIFAILVMAIGMWFGYRYASEQEDIPPEGHYEPSDTGLPRHTLSLVLAPIPAQMSQSSSFVVNIV